jgi:hypothetical protein
MIGSGGRRVVESPQVEPSTWGVSAKLRCAGDDVLTVVETGEGLKRGILFLVLGGVFAALTAVAVRAMRLPHHALLFGGLFGGAGAAVVGVGVWDLWFRRRRITRFDLREGRILECFSAPGRSVVVRREVALADVESVVVKWQVNPNIDQAYSSGELRLELRGQEPLYVMNHGDKRHLLEDAQRIATALKVELLDEEVAEGVE